MNFWNFSHPTGIDKFDDWLETMSQPSALMELGILAGCLLLAWLATWWLARLAGHGRRGTGKDMGQRSSVLFGRSIVEGVLFPLLSLCLALLTKAFLVSLLPVAVFKLAIPVLVALFVIRLGVKVLQVVFRDAPLVRMLERTISWGVWIGMVLWVSGLLPVVLEQLDDIHWKVGSASLSARTLLEGALTAGVVLLLTLWVSSAIESRLLRSATGNELSLRKAISNVLRVVLMFVGLLLALSTFGIDLTALSVLGGALGVGVGFGLQKLAASYVSGFVMLAERSVRIGDNVKVDGFEGRICDITARYTVVRSPTGRESIVPNEIFISNRVENLSLIDQQSQHTTVISVSYDSDVELVMRLLSEAALQQERVLQTPIPTVNLSNFGADGMEFTLAYWMNGADSGEQTLKSRVNVAVLKALRAHRIAIAYPQRVLHTRSSSADALVKAVL